MLLSEMFGVERGETFEIKECADRFMVVVDDFYTEFLRIQGHGKGEWVYADTYAIYQVIKSAPAGIIHLPPPLTDEQREQLKAIWTLGGRYLAKDCDGVVNYYTKIPYKESGYWFDNDDAERYGYAIPLSAGVCELQELNKADEPLDIGKALGVKK